MSASAPSALSLLNSVFGLTAYRGAQEEIVRHVTGGGNCLVLMPTGGGKSLCYQLPSLLREGCGIVVSPLIALMRDQVAGLTEAGVNAAVVGLLVAALYDPVWRTGITGPFDFGLAAVAFVLLAAWKAPPWAVVGLCAAAGWAASSL